MPTTNSRVSLRRMNYLSVEHISKSFGDRVLFEDLNFGIEKGQKVALVARNGAGKSTLFKILMGIETPDSGIISFNKEVRVGFLAQEHGLNDNLSILENVFNANNPMTRAIALYESYGFKRLSAPLGNTGHYSEVWMTKSI